MKHLFLFCVSAIIGLSSFAQSNKEDIDMVQAMYGKAKKDIVADFIKFPDSVKSASFWKLYDSYETERKALGRQRLAILQKYADSYATLDGKTTDAIMLQTMGLQKSVDGLIVTYYDKVKKSVGIKQAGQFYQLESYLLSATRVYILGNIPFIGELQKVVPPTPPAK
jgi:hypothetical protein